MVHIVIPATRELMVQVSPTLDKNMTLCLKKV
jgi:hypothetical protein